MKHHEDETLYKGKAIWLGTSFRGKMLGKIVLFVGIFFYATIPSYEAMPPFWTPNANAILQWSRPEGLQPERITDDPMDWKQPQEGSGEPLLLYNLQFEEPLVLNFGRFYF